MAAEKIILKSAEEIELMRLSAQLVSRTLGEVAKLIRPGITTLALDELAEAFIRDSGGIPGFKGLYNCPSTLLTSVNEAVIHGLPTGKPLREGDIVAVDCGVLLNGFYGDHAYTFAIGEVTPEVQRLLDVTKEALYVGVKEAYAGNRVGSLGYAIQKHVESNGFNVVRNYVGHGLGRSMHEKPEVANYGKRGVGKLMENGLTIAIEPMVNMGRKETKVLKDGWTVVTKDGKPSAHYEHDVAIINGKPVILSTFDYVEDVLGLPRTTAAMTTKLVHAAV